MNHIKIATVNGVKEYRVYKFQEIIGRFESIKAAEKFANMDETITLFHNVFKSCQTELFRCNPALHTRCKKKLQDLGELS